MEKAFLADACELAAEQANDRLLSDYVAPMGATALAGVILSRPAMLADVVALTRDTNLEVKEVQDKMQDEKKQDDVQQFRKYMKFREYMKSRGHPLSDDFPLDELAETEGEPQAESAEERTEPFEYDLSDPEQRKAAQEALAQRGYDLDVDRVHLAQLEMEAEELRCKIAQLEMVDALADACDDRNPRYFRKYSDDKARALSAYGPPTEETVRAVLDRLIEWGAAEDLGGAWDLWHKYVCDRVR